MRRYSDDTSSRENCGEYLAQRGVMLPQLESVIFGLGANQSSLAESPYGYHLIIVLEHRPASVLPYAQAQPQIITLLRNNAVQQRLSIFLLKLRAESRIVDYT